jgi:hypothetical protein
VGLGDKTYLDIEACVAGDDGKALLKASHFETMRLFAEHGGYNPAGHGYRPPLIPNIWLDDHQYNNPLVPSLNPYANLTERVCSDLANRRSKTPSSCQ